MDFLSIKRVYYTDTNKRILDFSISNIDYNYIYRFFRMLLSKLSVLLIEFSMILLKKSL